MSGTSTVQMDREDEKAAAEAVRLLYICDFPPSNLAGGSILMSRLLQDYPPNRVVVLTSSRYMRVSPQEGRLACDHIEFPTTKGWGRWGLGRIKNAIVSRIFSSIGPPRGHARPPPGTRPNFALHRRPAWARAACKR